MKELSRNAVISPLAASVLALLLYLCRLPLIYPIERTVYMGIAFLGLGIFAVLNCLSHKAGRAAIIAALAVGVISLSCVVFGFQRIKLSELTTHKETAEITCVEISPRENSSFIWWVPGDGTEISVEEGSPIILSGGDFDRVEATMREISVSNFWWFNKNADPLVYDLRVVYADGQTVRIAAVGRGMSVKGTANNSLSGLWYMDEPVSRLLDPGVVEYILSIPPQ